MRINMKILKHKITPRGKKIKIILNICVKFFLFPLFIVGFLLRMYDKNFRKKNNMEHEYKLNYFD